MLPHSDKPNKRHLSDVTMLELYLIGTEVKANLVQSKFISLAHFFSADMNSQNRIFKRKSHFMQLVGENFWQTLLPSPKG